MEEIQASDAPSLGPKEWELLMGEVMRKATQIPADEDTEK